jgi:hypothetical protein
MMVSFGLKLTDKLPVSKRTRLKKTGFNIPWKISSVSPFCFSHLYTPVLMPGISAGFKQLRI